MRETSGESSSGEGERQTKNVMYLDCSFDKTGVVVVLITGDTKFTDHSANECLVEQLSNDSHTEETPSW